MVRFVLVKRGNVRVRSISDEALALRKVFFHKQFPFSDACMGDATDTSERNTRSGDQHMESSELKKVRLFVLVSYPTQYSQHLLDGHGNVR